MSKLLTYFSPELAKAQLPKLFPSPFAVVPHPIALAAAEIVFADLSRESPLDHDFSIQGNGKMIGVLVVSDSEGRLGFLRGVSGMLGREWMVPGFVPPLFDVEGRESFWPAGQKRLDELGVQVKRLIEGPIAVLKKEEGELKKRLAEEMTVLRRANKKRKAARAHRREELASSSSVSSLKTGDEVFGESETKDAPELSETKELANLSNESQRDRRAEKVLKASHRAEREEFALRQQDVEKQRLEIRGKQKDVSNPLLTRLQAGYSIVAASGESRTLGSFFAPAIPPGGSGDCAAPKLLGYANSHNLRPIAIAEFWWGISPLGAVRHHASFYPPCKGRCQPILPFMLSDVELEPAPTYGENSSDAREPSLVYEDQSIAIVNKPSGMLSVPGASPLLQDSVLSRLRDRYPQASGPLLVHRLDLDTSGLLLMAKDLDVFRHLQEQFIKRSVKKQYLAWVEGSDFPEIGTIDLPLRVDLEDRPRQMVCPTHGKAANTQYKVLKRQKGRSLVQFSPVSGRTHQLRVHAAHILGLGAPIVGDRLYGRPGGRLLLHAQYLSITHPDTGEEIHFECPPPVDWPIDSAE